MVYAERRQKSNPVEYKCNYKEISITRNYNKCCYINEKQTFERFLFGTDGVFTLGETGQGSVTNTLCNTMWKLSHYILNGIGAGNYCPHCSGPSACLCLGPDSAQCDCNTSARSVHIFLKIVLFEKGHIFEAKLSFTVL